MKNLQEDIINDRLDRIEAKLEKLLKLLNGNPTIPSLDNNESQEIVTRIGVLPGGLAKEVSGVHHEEEDNLPKKRKW